MLQYTPSPPATRPNVRVISGRHDLCRAKTKKHRAQIALAVIDGARLYDLTKKQIAKLCDVSTSTISRARNGGIKRRTLADRIERATEAELIEVTRQLGPEWVWTRMVMPAI
jgi:acetolactate synthase regulatory subunit